MSYVMKTAFQHDISFLALSSTVFQKMFKHHLSSVSISYTQANLPLLPSDTSRTTRHTGEICSGILLADMSTLNC